MDGVLEGAVVLCVCKLACSLLFVPSLNASYSPVSFCCCCLLVFTDFLVAVSLSFLCVFGSWVTPTTPPGDVIALRFLLFLSHTYGAVLLLTTPLIAVETLTRLLWPHSVVVAHRAKSQTVDDDGQSCYTGKVAEEEEGEDRNNPDKDEGLSHVVSYLCCLSVWVVVALSVRWRWRLQEEWAADCLHTTNSLISCLPNLLSPIPITVNPCWGMVFLYLLLLLLTTSTSLHMRRLASARIETHQTKRWLNNNSDSCRQGLVPARSAPTKPVNRGMSVSESAQCVDPEKTESSCTVHRAYSWNIVQMLAHHHGDFVLISPGCLSAEWGGHELQRTKRGVPLTFITEGRVDSQFRSQFGWRRRWGFPGLWVNVMIGSVGVLSIFVLPLNLSVNILLIRTIETLLELFVISLVSSAANPSNTSVSHNETFV
ncbi:uncharacterized protein [Paralichthys olivaceus]|uniref:uncharacterized protein n=1 Tax=Paralichthys olivaceus TaxID=8255 RepID=UPI003750AD1F